MSDYTKSSKATSNDLWGHEAAQGGKTRAVRLREEEEAKGALKVKYSGQAKGPWVPRAIKKRCGGEFNVQRNDAEEGAAAAALEPASASAASASVSAAGSSSWNGAADLDDLADGDGKEARVGGDAKRARVEAPPAAADRDEVAEGAPRLAQHIRSSAKFVKVSAMAYGLLEARRVTEANAGAFFEVLAAGMEDPYRLREKEMRVAVRKLYGAAIERRHLFPEECQLQLRVWRLHLLTQIELFTDDNFQFSRACKAVREAVETLPCIYPALEPPGGKEKHLSEHERPVWLCAIFDCVEAAMLHHKHLWAKTTVDIVVRAMVDRRQNFSDEQQRTLQEWNARVKGQQIQRQQAHQQSSIHAKREQTAYERKEAEWHSADITTAKGGDVQGGNIDNWMAKQGNN
tara:strand:+ start:24 stop:1229 length:1206 start_codon:yes stop_codon:yes gene_type:complete